MSAHLVSADEAWSRIDHPSIVVRTLAHTVVVQAEQIATVLALHVLSIDGGWCAGCGLLYPCHTARALGVTA